MSKMLTVLLTAVLLGGCAAKPTQNEIDSADYGYSIYQSDAETIVKQFFQMYLKDPESATYSFGQAYRGYYVSSMVEGRKLITGYLIDVSVNAKNSYGGYVGAKPYKFIIKSGKIQAGYEIGHNNVNIRIL